MIDSTAPVAVITGGGGGIGWATGRRLGAEGWTVVLADIDPDAGRRAADVGSRAESRFLDVADASSLRPFIDAVGTDHGRVDALICAAGIEPPLDLAGLDVAGWDRTLQVPRSWTATASRSPGSVSACRTPATSGACSRNGAN